MMPRTLSARLREMYSGTLAGEEPRRRRKAATRTAATARGLERYGLPAMRALFGGRGPRGAEVARRRMSGSRSASPKGHVPRWLMASPLVASGSERSLLSVPAAAPGRPARAPAPKPEAAVAPVVVLVTLGPDGEVVNAQAIATGGPGRPVPWPEILEALKRPAASPPGNERHSRETQG